jgi:hypothetical protein
MGTAARPDEAQGSLAQDSTLPTIPSSLSVFES